MVLKRLHLVAKQRMANRNYKSWGRKTETVGQKSMIRTLREVINNGGGTPYTAALGQWAVESTIGLVLVKFK